MRSEFETYTRSLFGDELFARYEAAMHEEPPVSVRLNPFKRPVAWLDSAEKTAVPWCRDAYWLALRPDFTLDPLLHAGCYYVQEAASMFLDEVLLQLVTEPITMLDLCAAPGGKSTLARAALPQGSLLYCNEPDPRRANILVENMQKQGHPDVVVTSNHAIDYRRSGARFDLILADVPCSGEGMLRRITARASEGESKAVRAMQEWSVSNVLRCQELQRGIVSDIWPCLKDGGLLVYSTCTFNTRENEENAGWLAEELGAEFVAVRTDPHWHIIGSLLDGFSTPVYRFIPGATRSEGLFMAVLRKHGEGKANKPFKTRDLRLLYDGRDPAKDKTKHPSHAEALLISGGENTYPRIELSLDQALAYLRREAIVLTEAPRGHVIVCHQGHPLGFVNNLGHRANNLYPHEWRIRHK